MDRITTRHLESFSKEYGIESLSESSRFEQFAAFSMARRHYDRTFVPAEIWTGSGGDTGVDAIAILVNNVLVTDVDMVNDLAEQNNYVDATFIFVQAERTDSFSGETILSTAAGIRDFFSETPKLIRNEAVKEAAVIRAAIYERMSSFRERPTCLCYYVTTGKWTGDKNLDARRTTAIEDITKDGWCGSVDFLCYGRDELQLAYNQTRNPVSREFRFTSKLDIPQMPGVEQAFLGFIPVSAFRAIVSDASGKEILGSIFDGNVRDWQAYEIAVNQDIQKTLKSDARSRFVLMNNGITIIARSVKSVNDRFTITDFDIVNGCQTSHVVFNESDLDDSVFIPLRLIETRDEHVIESIIHATNNQTPLKAEHLMALMAFSRKLEDHFKSYEPHQIIYYERRDGQYDRVANIEKTRIIVPANVIRAFAAIFLCEPHRATRNYKALRQKVGTEIFGSDHCLEPYYAAAYGNYRLDYLFRNDARFTSKYRPAKYLILLAARLLIDKSKLPFMNSKNMIIRANAVIERFWDQNSDDLFLKSIEIVDGIADSDMNRDNIRQKPITDKLLAHFGLKPEIFSSIETNGMRK